MKMKFKKYLLVFVALQFFILLNTQAQQVADTSASAIIEDNSFITKSWTEGWYFLAGIGPSTSVFSQSGRTEHSPSGGHVSSTIGYFSKGGYGFEIGSYIDVPFFYDFGIETPDENRDVDINLWNTLFFLSIRARLPEVQPTSNWDPFIKVFYGFGAGVMFFHLDDDDPWKEALDDRRLQLEGPVFGLSFTNFFNTQSDDVPVWFLELSVSTQLYQERYFIEAAGDLPLVLDKQATSKNDELYVVRLSAGIRVF